MKNKIYCSTSTLGQAGDGQWYDLEAAIEIIPQVECDGFELCIHPEWQSGKLMDGTKIAGYPYPRIHELGQKAQGRIRAIHAQKDICAFLDRDDGESQTKGIVLLEEAYKLGKALEADYIVFHGWYFDAQQSFQRIVPVLNNFKEVSIPLSIETLPSPRSNSFCKQVVEFLPTLWGLTLDLYHTHDLQSFEDWLLYVGRFTNIHVQCFIDEEAGCVKLVRNKRGSIDILYRLERILEAGYRGPITLEPNGRYSMKVLNQALQLLRDLVDRYKR